MNSTDHFVWNADPVAFDIGAIPMPFPIAIWGLIAAFIFIYIGYQKLTPDNLRPGEEPDIPAGKFWGLVIGSLVLGQVLFMLLPSPTFSEIGPIQPRWYGVLFASSFVVGYFIMRHMFIEAGRKEEEVDQLLTYVLIGTVIGARLGHVLFYDPSYYLRNPAEILAIWHGGLASHGAAIAIIIAMYLYTQKKTMMSFLWLADRVVVVVAIAGAFIRTGNFFNSEIIGEPTDLSWGVIFAQRPDLGMIPRHPTMLYEAVLCILIFGILWAMYRLYKKKPPEGSLFGTFLALLFTGRFMLEFTKIDQAAFASEWAINMGQWLSIPLVAAGLWILIKKVDWNKTPADNTRKQ